MRQGHYKKKRKLQINDPYEYRCRTPQKNIGKLNKGKHLKYICHSKIGFISEFAHWKSQNIVERNWKGPTIRILGTDLIAMKTFIYRKPFIHESS